MATAKSTVHVPPKGTKLVWLPTHPVKVGWYMASKDKDPRSWRWWNGRVWSLNVHSHRAASTAARRAKKEAPNQSYIQYTMYYPANARVARPV